MSNRGLLAVYLSDPSLQSLQLRLSFLLAALFFTLACQEAMDELPLPHFLALLCVCALQGATEI